MQRNSITIPYNFQLRPYQLNLFSAMDNGIKRAVCMWPRRSGKDLCFWNYIIKQAYTIPGNYYYIFPSYTQAKKVIWEGKTKHGRAYMDYLPPNTFKTNSNELKIETVFGSIIRLIGSDNIDALRGAGPRGVVFSEFSWQSQLVWDTIRPMLAENAGWALFNSTPRGKNHFYDLIVQVAGNNDWYSHSMQALWPDRKNYWPVISSVSLDKKLENKEITFKQWWELATRETIEAIEKERQAGMEEDMIEQEYGCSFVAGQKGAYYIDCVNKAREQNRIGTYLPSDHKFVDTFWDIGATDDTAVWFRQTDGNKVIWIDYYETNTEGMMHYILKLKEKGYKYRTHYLPHDGGHSSWAIPNGGTIKSLFIKMCEQAGISSDVYVVTKTNNKQLPIQLVRERFSTYFFNEQACADGIKKLELYHRQYDRASKTFRDYPAHDWCCHAADAISLEALTADFNMDKSFYGFNNQKIITDFDPLNYE